MDALLTDFSLINRHIRLEGPTALLRTLTKDQLLRKVATTNLLLTDVLIKVRVLDRMPDLAWKYAHYGRIWEFVKNDLELDTRFEALKEKTGLVQEDIKFLLEVLNMEKSHRLEWIIIWLIAVEIGLSLWRDGIALFAGGH